MPVDEAARILGVDASTVRRWVEDRRLPGVIRSDRKRNKYLIMRGTEREALHPSPEEYAREIGEVLPSRASQLAELEQHARRVSKHRIGTASVEQWRGRWDWPQLVAALAAEYGAGEINKELGVSGSTFLRWAKGKQTPSLRNRRRLWDTFIPDSPSFNRRRWRKGKKALEAYTIATWVEPDRETLEGDTPAMWMPPEED
ncbi:MAG: helix-turn-helix domain-containing protein [Armatimonadota bacterium]